MLRKKHLISFFLLTVISQTAIALDFAEALQRAKTNDPEIQAAEYSYQAVLQSRGLSEAALLPNISLAVYTTQNQQDISNSTIASIPNGSSDSDTQGYTLSLTQSIYNHSNYKLLQQTDINIATAKAEIEAARQALILRVANVYYNVLAAADNVKFAVAEKQAIARQLEQTRKRFEVGLIAITDVKESQAQYDIAVAQQISADNKLDISKEALRSLIGPLDQNVSPLSDNVPLVIPQPNDIRQWTDTAIANNLTLQAAQLAFEAAQKQVDIEQSGHYPSLDLSVQHSDDQLDNDAGDRDSEDTRLSLQLNIPIYSGGYTSARTRQAVARMEQQRALREKAYRQTIQQSRDSYLGVTTSIAQVNALKQVLISTQTAHQATQAGYEAGTRTAVDVLAALREQYRAERDYAQTRYTYILNILKLKQAAGILSENDALKINQWLKH